MLSISRGIYSKQLQQYAANFRPNQLLVLQSEFFYQNTNQTLNQVANFIGLEAFDFSTVAQEVSDCDYQRLSVLRLSIWA